MISALFLAAEGLAQLGCGIGAGIATIGAGLGILVHSLSKRHSFK